MEARLRRATEETASSEAVGAFGGILTGIVAGSAIWVVLLLAVLTLR